MLCCVWAIADEDPFPVLVDVGLVPFFLGDDYADDTAENLEVADVLPFARPAFLWY